MKVRIPFIDVAKGIGIFLVVFGHTYRAEDLKIFIYSFHIPLFFFISGLFIKDDSHKKILHFLQQKLKSLLIPYVTFYLISYVYWLFIERYIRPGHEVSALIPLAGFFYGTDYKQFMLPNGALWFLTCLFVVEIIVFLTIQLTNKITFRIFAFLLFPVIGYLINYYIEIPFPFSIKSAFMAIIFTGFGFLSKNILFKLGNQNKVLLLILSAVFFAILWWSSSLNGLIDMDYAKYNNIFLFIINAFIGIISCFMLSVSISNFQMLKYLGINSIIIMGISEPIKRAVIAVFSKVISRPIEEIRFSTLYSFICVLLVLLLLVPITNLFNNKLYYLLGRSKIKSVQD